MKRKLLTRAVLFYVAYCIVGFIPTTYMVSKFDHPFSQITATLADLKMYFFTESYLLYLIYCLIGLAFLILYIIHICRPIHLIASQATQYADGDYSEQIPIQRSDEMGYITNVMNCMAQELDSLEEDQRKFISNISHDFRSPLTSIKGYAEAMADGTIPVEFQEKYLNIIVFETERLEKLTQNLLDLNKYSSKGAFMDISVFDINEQIKRTLPTFEGRCTEKNLEFELLLYPGTLNVRADSAKIDQVIHNLIDNAIKFSDHNSRITIETTTRSGKAFVSIKDYGIGIPKDSLNKIWERFYKTDLSRGKDKKGTGLGLSIVKEIIHAHHENINVISTEGVGTEFIFTLPLKKQ